MRSLARKGEVTGEGAEVRRQLEAVLPGGDELVLATEVVSNFLIIKLNSWLRSRPVASELFYSRLIDYHNGQWEVPSAARFSRDDGQLTAQLLLSSNAYECVRREEVEDLLEGSATVAVAGLLAIRNCTALLEKFPYVLVMGLISLHARPNAYLPIVHEEKHHAGQIELAKRIHRLIPLHPEVEPALLRSRRWRWT